MIGVIRRPNWKKPKPVNPDDYFDPTTHTATEADFLAFLEAGGKYDDTSLIGYKVVLSNTAAYNNGIWIIADVNHDSANTGQSNCYDLISQDCINPGVAYGSSNNQWRSSNVRTWLNSTFYNGFSNAFKNRLLNPKYNSDGDWYIDDKIIEPSFTEVNGNVPTDFSSITIVEGVKYPIFESGSSSREKNSFGQGTVYYWWTRSKYRSTNIWYVLRDMSNMNDYTTIFYLAPILRVQ